MFGSIIGDIAGSTYEFKNFDADNFELLPPGSKFTDDTVLTIAIADAIMSDRPYQDCILEYARRYPRAGYGKSFIKWIHSKTPKPYNSFGNGSAMRAGPVGWAFDSIDRVLDEARATALPTHNHPEGIKGAQAIAVTVYTAKTGVSKEDIKEYVENQFGYSLSDSFEKIKAASQPNVICQETVPQSLICFLASHDFEDAIRKAIRLGGDTDTMACITGSVAEAYYKEIPDYMVKKMENILDDFLMEKVCDFRTRYLPA